MYQKPHPIHEAEASMKVAWTVAPVDPRRGRIRYRDQVLWKRTAQSTRMSLAAGGRPELEEMLARMFVSVGASRKGTWMCRLAMVVSAVAVNRPSAVRVLVNHFEPGAPTKSGLAVSARRAGPMPNVVPCSGGLTTSLPTSLVYLGINDDFGTESPSQA